jgi:type VI secretion system protein ImpA
VRTLDRLCDYYARYEPSSPVPLLLKRARRLVDGSFIDILSDLTPSSLAEIKHLAGIATD